MTQAVVSVMCAARCYRVVESLVESRFHEDADTVQRCAALASHPALQRQVSPALFQALSQCASQHATPDESIQQARRLADTLHLLCAVRGDAIMFLRAHVQLLGYEACPVMLVTVWPGHVHIHPTGSCATNHVWMVAWR